MKVAVAIMIRARSGPGVSALTRKKMINGP